MALVSIIDKSSLRLSRRLDADHYSPRFVPILGDLALHSTVTLRRTLLEQVRTGHTPSTKIADYYDPGVVQFIKTDDLREDTIEVDDIQMLSEAGNARIASSELRADDVIVTIIGATEDIIGRAARVCNDLGRANINQNIALIRSRIHPGYLSVFLNTRYGREQLIWLSRQTGQVNLNCREVEELTIPLLSNDIINAVECLSTMRHKLLSRSIQSYNEAERIFLSAIGMQDRMLTHDLAYVQQHNAVIRAHRLDADHFQPKYSRLLDLLESRAERCRRVIEFSKFNARGVQPVYVEDGSLRVITSKNILEKRLDYHSLHRTESSYWDTCTEARVYCGDILIYTTGANVGRVAIYLDDERALASNHVNILRVRGENPIYVSLVLNSPVGRLQTRKHISGSTQSELYPSHIDQFIVPFVSNESEEQISSLVTQSNIDRNGAKTLLELAKHFIEVAISNGEEDAKTLLSEAMFQSKVPPT